MRALGIPLVVLAALALATPAVAATTFRVDSTAEERDANPGDGVCATTAGACTVRAALEEADALRTPTRIVRPALADPSRLLVVRDATPRPQPRAPVVTFTVDTTADAPDAVPGDGVCATAGGDCTLRAAIQESNDLAGTQAIVLPAGHYALTLDGDDEDAAATGDLDLLDSVTLTGAGADVTRVDGGGAMRVVENFFGPFVLSGVTITGGAPDGLHDFFAHAEISDCRFTGNTTGWRHQSGGPVTVTDTHFAENAQAAYFTSCQVTIDETVVTSNDLGFYFDSSVTGTIRDTIFHENTGLAAVAIAANTLTFRRVAMTDNGAGFAHQGGDLSNSVTIEESVITGNAGHGASYSDGQLLVANTRLSGNGGCGVSMHGNDGGGLTVRDTVVQRNGCGILAHGGRGGVSTTIERTQIVDNTGVGVDGVSSPRVRPLTVRDSQISRNAAGGVAIQTGNGGSLDVRISGTTISDNGGERGAGLLLTRFSGTDGSTVRLVNSTISRNTATDAGDAVYNDGAELDLRNVTVTGDVVTLDGFSTTARNSILAGGCVGVLTSAGHDVLDGDLTACTVVGDTTGNLTAAPRLGPLVTNGGPTTTHALLAGSPAWNGGDPAGCVDADGAVLTTDQRGLPRPQAGRCDVGAFESACGNGTIDDGETCDDGNVDDGDCCSGACRIEPDGSSCSDGDACSTGDRCAAGVCTPTGGEECGPCLTCAPEGGCVVAPRTGCRQPTERLSGELEIFAKPNRRSIEWSWVEGEATSRAELGDPLADDRYTFCLYDEATAAPRLAFAATTRTDPCGKRSCWKPTGKTGFLYTAPSSDLLRKVVLRSGADGKAKVVVTAKGDELVVPSLPLALPIRAQLHAENGACWESRFEALGTKKNDAKHFRGKASLP